MNIISNGSHWAGESPDDLATLLDVLGRETLDPRFEDCGCFFYRAEDGQYHAFGNFLTASHVFSIVGTLEEMLPLAQALKAARQRPEYQRMRVQSFSWKW